MKMYTIIGGVNGVGKSSFTGSLKSQSSSLGFVIDVDKITAENGNNPIEGAKIAIDKIENCLKNGYNFTQESTLSGNKTSRTCKKAKESGYYIRLYYIGIDSEEESLKRIRNRVEKGGHNIPTEDVHRRFENRFKVLNKVLPYCDEAFFFDNNNGFEEVAKYRNGEFAVTTEKEPNWFKEFRENLKL